MGWGIPIASMSLLAIVAALRFNAEGCGPPPLTIAAPPRRQAIVEPPSAPARLHVAISVAAFDRDLLYGCVDVVADSSAVDAAVTPVEMEDVLFKLMATDPTKSKTAKMTRISRPCGEQFGDRTIFGGCSKTIDGGLGVIAVRSFIYSFDRVFSDDKAMRKCLDTGGDWKAISRNSDAFNEARLHHDMGSLRKMIGRSLDDQ